MAGFFDKVTDMAKSAAQVTGDFAKTAADKGAEMVEVSRLNSQIRAEESVREELYQTLGKKYEEKIMNDELEVDPVAEDLCKQLREREAAIANLEMEIQKIKA